MRCSGFDMAILDRDLYEYITCKSIRTNIANCGAAQSVLTDLRCVGTAPSSTRYSVLDSVVFIGVSVQEARLSGNSGQF